MIYLVLPAFNEEQDLPELLPAIQKNFTAAGYQYQLILVNDGSSDRTKEIVRGFLDKLPLVYLEHEVNKGLGAAMKTGLRKAAEIAEPDDVIVAMDADNSHDSYQFTQMLKKIEDGDEVVIASRFTAGAQEIGLTLKRKLMSRVIGLFLRLFFPIKGVRDYTCGYRAYRAALLQQAFEFYGDDFITTQTFAVQTEIILKLSRLTKKISEVPLILRYDLKAGQSKLKLMRTIKGYLAVICNFMFHTRRK